MAYDSACILSFKTSLIFDTNRGFRFWQTCRFVCIYWRYALWVLCKFEVHLYVCVESVPIVNQMEQLKDWVTYLVDCSGYPFCCCKQQLSHNTWRFSNVSHDITSFKYVSSHAAFLVVQIHLNQTEVVELILRGKVKRALIWENFDEQYKVISSIEYQLKDNKISQ